MKSLEENYLLKKVFEAGFNPIGFTTMICEESLIFRTQEEADKAAKMFLPEGYWYSLREFDEERDWYVKKHYNGNYNDAPIVYWFDRNFKPGREDNVYYELKF